MAFGRLEEQVADWRCESRIDRRARVLRNIALTGRESKNGYRYSEEALKNAARLYEHKPVFLDHADRPSGTANRSTRDLVGSIVNSRFEDGRIRSDVRVLDTESGRTFLALAAENTPGVGMSHVVLAHRSADGQTVEKIDDVLSVDVVIRPATTTTIRESEPTRLAVSQREVSTETPEADREAVLLERLSRLSEQMESLWLKLADVSGPSGPGGPATTTAQEGNGRGREALSSPVASHADDSPPETTIEELLLESRLPEFALSGLFRELLMQADSDASRRALIADRRLLLEQAGRGRARSVERVRDARESARAIFVASIRGR
jgi:hypothetical protein